MNPRSDNSFINKSSVIWIIVKSLYKIDDPVNSVFIFSFELNIFIYTKHTIVARSWLEDIIRYRKIKVGGQNNAGQPTAYNYFRFFKYGATYGATTFY